VHDATLHGELVCLDGGGGPMKNPNYTQAVGRRERFE
jgi:hypothetical protein